MANRFPGRSVTSGLYARKEEGQVRSHPLSWVSSNTDSGRREQAAFKKEYLLSEALAILLAESTGWGTFSKLDVGSEMWNHSTFLP